MYDSSFQKCQKFNQEKKSGKSGQTRNDQGMIITKKIIQFIFLKNGITKNMCMLFIMGKMPQGSLSSSLS